MWNQEDMRHSKYQPAPLADSGSRRTGDASNAGVPHFGRSVFVKGEVNASEDLTIDGQVEGRIDLPDHVVTVGPNATIAADITARVAMILGSAVGSITAREKLDVRRGGLVEGTVSCGRLVVEDGANVHAKVETKVERRPREQAAPKALVDRTTEVLPIRRAGLR